jgi:hypothetical protein
MSTPISSEAIRYGYPDADSAHRADRFAVWGSTRWIWAVAPWLLVLYFAYPVVWATYHARLPELPPSLWLARALYFAIVFILVPAQALYAGWIAFVVLRVTGDRITVGRWFGVRQRAYCGSDVATWRLFDGRSREVREANSASGLRIDFTDGSWVSMSRRTWNYKKLEAWLGRWVGPEAGVVSRASNAAFPTHRFVVRDIATKFLALMWWALCWIMVAGVVRTLPGRFGRPSELGDVALYALALVIPFVLGPLCAHLVLKDVRVDAARIHVHRWFGLIRRTYHEDDIKAWRVRPDSGSPLRQKGDSSLLLRFADGTWVFVTARAINFCALHSYLRDRAASRQAVPRGGERSATAS